MNAPLRPSHLGFVAPTGTQDTIKDALFQPMGVDGVYARTGLYEGIVERLAAYISSQREAGTEVLRFPPVMSRRDLERHGYLKSFPNLLGCVCALHGTDAEISAAADRHMQGGDWTSALSPSDLVLSPAACYPVYPIVAARGPLPAGGAIFDVACDCFRHEPSPHLDRLQSFRMREYVCIGAPQDVNAFRERWMVRAQEMADALALPCRVETASDPFFGRIGQVMALSQLHQALKFELVVPLKSVESPTACMSFNAHRDHFGTTWNIEDADGNVAHTGCVAFGMDRLAVALFWTHGLDPAAWPASARSALAL
ncbi:amino acid--[acyl-carrier-protein] ligase [Lichenihabitans sp. PAMC28606]|uniref:amino acid--[acyl-carrier-protein] ligase n=1 Tax=Lichenihabitans TaxID=2723776 RepID=UPI0010383B3A|nr:MULTISPECIES: amino acid--[acyl-carrier-protein] ligase [Lichenihabitans]UDL94111.1 amino acid--[acyl-carrier-protein] ligase [Lichenihabitans sp. PAMC28606]